MAAGLLTFTVAFITSLAAAVPIRQFALRVGMVDTPGPRKIHLEPIPLLGGIAIYAALIVALLISHPSQALTEILGIVFGATLLLLVGTLDDRGLLHDQVKLFLAMPIAALIVFASGTRAQIFSGTPHGQIDSAADAALTVLWITGITAAFSILDYMDGLCAGVAALASLFIAILAVMSGQALVNTLAAALAGAALGFLRWNFSPARIFMGDGGAMLLGFWVATLALKLHGGTVSPHAAWLVPLLVLALPIFDTILVSVSRLRRGLVPFASPGKDHTGHRLANYGLGARGSVVIIYMTAFSFGLLAILSTRLSSGWLDIMAAIILAASVAAIVLLERLPYERQDWRRISSP